MSLPHHAFDAVTVEDLRAAGGLKWTLFPDRVGAFVAEMDFGTAPPVTEALQRAVAAGNHGYLPPAEGDRLARSTAGFLERRHGWQVPPERIRPLPDVITGLRAAIEHFTPPGSPVVVPTPAYMPFLTVPAAMGREQIEVPLVLEQGPCGLRHVYDLDALDAALGRGAGLVVLCNPHNPVGRVLRPEELRGFAEVVARHDVRVFADEIHAPLVFPGHRHVPYASLDDGTAAQAITAVSASKGWNLPGLKCAQLVLSNDTDAARWDDVGYAHEHGTANLGVAATCAAYDEGGEWLAEVVDYLDGSRRLLADLVEEHLPGVAYRQPEGTYLALLDFTGTDLGDRPAAYLAEHAGVALTEGEKCGRAAVGQVRYNLATPRPVMEATIAAMGRALPERRLAG